MEPTSQVGRLEVITGCMFSGKTEELLRRIRRAEIARLPCQIIKPALDTRAPSDVVETHTGTQYVGATPSHACCLELLALQVGAVVGIDEVQFFDSSIVQVVKRWVASGHRVIAAGLDLDFRGDPFGQVHVLMALAQDIQKLSAVCMVCGAAAWRSQRLRTGGAFDGNRQIYTGGRDRYEARCLRCWENPE